MSATTAAATGRCFGIQRVCQVWERSRSALYARRARAHHRLGAGPARRGPPPRQSDAQLLAAIRTESPTPLMVPFSCWARISWDETFSPGSCGARERRWGWPWSRPSWPF